MINKRPLSLFNLAELGRIVEEFGNKSRIFNSEAQFQFELAWKIKEQFDCEVKLEELSRVQDIEKIDKKGKVKNVKKDYTDIILESDNLRIAIELKYKTSAFEMKEENVLLKSHGAVDLGAYDFLWDVNRLQVLTGEENNTVKQKCNRGYALMLTNDEAYWKAQPSETINRQFLIGGDANGHGCLKEGKHEWFNTDNKPGLSKVILNNPSRAQRITFRKDYCYRWQNYCSLTGQKNVDFKFMIVEVD